MFEIYTKEVKIQTMVGEEVIRLRPLSGRYFPKLMSIITKLGTIEGDSKEFLKNLDAETSSNLHYLILESIKKSYPNEDIEKLDEFVTQNIFSLIGPIFEVNINNKN